MTLFGVLNVGASGMRVHQFGVQVASDNATNVATDGYSRRTASITPLAPELEGGARESGSRRVFDPFVEKRLLGAKSYFGQADAQATALDSLDQLFADVDGNLASALSSFEAALGDFASHPNETATRGVVLAAADELSRSFQRASVSLDEITEDLNARVTDSVRQLNEKLREIGALNQRIASSEVPSGREASDLRDRRDQLLREASEIVPVTVLRHDDGTVDALLGGSLSLVNRQGDVSELIAVPDATTGNVAIERMTAGRSESVGGLIDSGRIAGYTAARDGAVASTRAALDQLAFDLASAYNTAHSAGVGADGGTGRNLFEPLAGVSGAAGSIGVSADVRGAPDRLAGAIDAGALPGDNRGALALLAVKDQNVALGGTATIGTAFGAILGSVGAETRAARGAQEHATAVAEQTQSLRDAVSGVSSDEEMISLMKFQRAYQASLQIVQTADELLGELIAMKR
jgi:flagellar hook-associated protein 1 FlgK